MPSVGSSVLILLPMMRDLSIEADYIDPEKLVDYSIRPTHKVLVIDANTVSEKKLPLVIEQFLDQSGNYPRIILLNSKSYSLDFQVDQFNSTHLARVHGELNPYELEQSLTTVLHELRNQDQNSELVKLVKNNNEELRRAYKDLEDRINKRTSELNQSRLRLQTMSRREAALQQGLLAIFKGRSLGEIETLLLENLKTFLNLDLVRIFHLNQDQLSNQKDRLSQSFSVYETPLFHLHDKIGVIYFLREKDQPFSRSDQDFMQKLAEAIALALHRLEALMESEALNIQWQATFNALSEPVGIINKRYEILQANRSFTDKAKIRPDQIAGVKCYEAMFGRTSPCESCQLGKKFVLRENKDLRVYDVSSQSVAFVTEEEEVFVHLYRDITEQQRLEKQLLESTKLAELGIIGSSIAHELNNPVGGILSFAQLIKMDLSPTDPLYEEIIEIENGARRCKEIIQNLLSFARDPAVDRIEDMDLRDVISRAIKIVELKTRSKGIQVTYVEPNEAFAYRGHFNLLSQALQNILQNALESLDTKLKTIRGFNAMIDVRLKKNAESILITIEDNGPGISPSIISRVKEALFTTKDPSVNPGLGLAITERIITDHGGSIEVNSDAHVKTSISIRLPSQALSP